MKTVTLNESAIRHATHALLGPERAQILGEVYDVISNAQEEAFSEGYERGHEQGDREGFERGFKVGYDLGHDVAVGTVEQPLLPAPYEITSDLEALQAEDMRFVDDVDHAGC